MTLKGKKKFLRNIIACLIAVMLLGGITSVVYSNGNASVKIHYGQDSDKETWDTKDEFNKKWFTNLKNGKLNFVVDLKEYYEIVSKTKEIILEEPFQIIAAINELNNIAILDTDVTKILDENGNFDGEYNVKITYKDKNKTLDKISNLLLTFLIENNYSNEVIDDEQSKKNN